jgi:hypothetical protein
MKTLEMLAMALVEHQLVVHFILVLAKDAIKVVIHDYKMRKTNKKNKVNNNKKHCFIIYSDLCFDLFFLSLTIVLFLIYGFHNKLL